MIPRTLRAAVLTVLAFGVLQPPSAVAREIGIEQWLDERASKHVARTLAEHPRFRGAVVRFVVMRNGTPQPEADGLSLLLRDRLQRLVVDSPGVNVAWRPDRDGANPTEGNSECVADNVQYLIGLELHADTAGTARLSIRALDVIEKTWVAAFGREWVGRLTRSQLRAAQQSMADRSYLGDRSVPYAQNETDLMAAHLARSLRCQLKRGLGGEYVVSTSPAVDPGDELSSVVDLVGNYVAGSRTLRFAGNSEDSNATIAARAHPIDGGLHQYWITLTPKGPDPNLQPLSASVYVRLARQQTPVLADREDTSPTVYLAETVDIDGSGFILDSMQLVTRPERSCAQREALDSRTRQTTAPHGCRVLEISTDQDAVVFVLNHQLNRGLVRIDADRCERRTAARIARAREPIAIVIPDHASGGSWTSVPQWQLEPDANTFYAIAVSDSRAARDIADHLDNLPRRCSASVRQGYEGGQLEGWLTGLAATIDRWRPQIGWAAIAVRNVY